MTTAGMDSSPPSSSPVPGRGVAMEFPVTDYGHTAPSLSFSSHKIPKRLRNRLLECNTKTSSSTTAQDIEAKLRLADLRRQQFYEKLSSKARPKPKSPSSQSSNEEDPGHRLEAKLLAAQYKRLSILEKVQLRLARLDELRQAAKNEVERRFEQERELLGTKMDLKVQQAEANRMLILKAHKQRRATLKERTSQSLVRRMCWESKYKERIHAAIHQKRLAAEKKRLLLLEAEKKRAYARVMQVQRVAKSVSYQREAERRRLGDQLEDRLQRAKRHRAEYLRQRGRQHSSAHDNWSRMHKQADLLSKKLARCWRQFLKSRKTTLDLTKEYDALKINKNSIKTMPFEQLARHIESNATLQTVKAFLDRLESRFLVSMSVISTSQQASLCNIDHLLKRVATPRKRPTPRPSLRTRVPKEVTATRDAGRTSAKLARYPVRIALCAYMILGHPDAVLSSHGEREVALAKAAGEFIREFELLIRVILDGPIQSSDEESDAVSSKRCNFRSQLAAFDKAWCCYLNCFVVWKVKDAQILVGDLVRAACQLELSMIHKCKLTQRGDADGLTHDMKAIQRQVAEDQRLLREKVHHLLGDAGIERMESALSETRSKAFQANENGSPPVHFISPITPTSLASTSVASAEEGGKTIDTIERPSRVIRSLFREDTSTPQGSGSTKTSQSHLDAQSGSSTEKMVLENELIVHEFLHEEQNGFVDRFSDNGDSIKVKIRETMETAFWDCVVESMRQKESNYDQIIQLMKEVRDEICEIAPESWKQEIFEAIDLDILTQVLTLTDLDINYFGKILEFVVHTLQKLSSPAHEAEMKSKYQKMLGEWTVSNQTRDDSKYSCAVVMMVRGLRFMLEQIQVLKQEISKARLKMMASSLKGPTGFDYLRKAFSNRYGSHSDACTTLPLTIQWLSSAKNGKDKEWNEHTSSLASLVSCESSSLVAPPTNVLKTGGNFLVNAGGNGSTSVSAASKTPGHRQPQPECKGETIDLLVRIGLLKLVSGISGLTQESLPETLALNLSRLRTVQAEVQKIVVISASILICRQTLLMERVVTRSTDMEKIVSDCSKQLQKLLDSNENAGIEEIVEVISGFLLGRGEEVASTEKLQSWKVVMARTLGKSLQAGDPVFEKVSRAVYLAMRGVVLGGSGSVGRKLAEMTLRQVGAVGLTERVVEAGETIVVAATVSVNVHRSWYINLTVNM